MPNPVCLSPLKFYDNVKKQNHRKSYAFGNISPLIAYSNTLLPFQFVCNTNPKNITAAYLYNVDTDTRVEPVTNLINELKGAGLVLYKTDKYSIVQFPGIYPLPNVKLEGLYYLAIMASTGEWYYSEVFCCTNYIGDCLKIEYWNPEADFVLKNGLITFANNFKFKLYLKTELGKPEYEFEEEATERLGYSFIESQVSKKIYKFTVLVPEYLCDAMRIIRLCSNKVLTCLDETYDMLSFNMDVEWQDQGDTASAECEFEVDNVIVNLGGYKHENLGGDYDNDFNNDFNKQ